MTARSDATTKPINQTHPLATGSAAYGPRKRSTASSTVGDETLTRKAKVRRLSVASVSSHVDLALDYQEALPTELQDAIMRHLAGSDPKSALHLAATSKQQAAVLDRLLPRFVRENPLLVATEGATPTAADYLRARIALGAEDTNAVVLLRLMEGFIRFLFSMREWMSWRGIRDEHRTATGHCALHATYTSTCDWCSWSYKLFPIDDVLADPLLGDTRQRAQAWYRWLTAPPPIAVPNDWPPDDMPPADLAFMPRMSRTCLNRDLNIWYNRPRASHNGRPPVPDCLRGPCDYGIEVGNRDAAATGFTAADTAQAVMFFERYKSSSVAWHRMHVLFDDTRAKRLLGAWTQRDRSAQDIETRRLLGSTAARDGFCGTIDGNTLDHIKGVDDRLLGSGPLRLVRFTDAFRPKMYLVPDVDVFFAMDIASPEIETLLGIC
ncbi:hypothetical protein psal_cds_615 [Pandoravirus salinus]|uniref:Uncharacterized protein n=1 Tax=Pandoravirus salinus TaxID=1349410 RepID=S4VV77_9VIRU|nr:hypothetical protein psal_cds_615 [Pandoravirus salinus]AGO84494.1 hypothetical protein psal_cds_615 [Pandoravirus salinus]